MSGGRAARVSALRAAARQAEDVSDALSNFIRACREVADALEEEREPAVMLEEEREPAVMAELIPWAQGCTRELGAAMKPMLAFLRCRADDMGMPGYLPRRRRN